jgi:hypothetical protein
MSNIDTVACEQGDNVANYNAYSPDIDLGHSGFLCSRLAELTTLLTASLAIGSFQL